MKMKAIGLVLILIGVFSVLVFRAASKSRQQSGQMPPKNQLRWQVQQAKLEGRQNIEIPLPMIDYLGSEDSDLDAALASYTVVVAEIIDHRTFEHLGNDLITWYKFKIKESLSPLRPPLCPTCNSYIEPAELLPLQPHEFLLPQIGGRAIIEGVHVSQLSGNFSEFKKNRDYLLFVSLYPNGIAFTAGGPIGVFTVDPNGIISPISNKSHPLILEMTNRFGNSLALVRQKTKQISEDKRN